MWLCPHLWSCPSGKRGEALCAAIITFSLLLKRTYADPPFNLIASLRLPPEIWAQIFRFCSFDDYVALSSISDELFFLSRSFFTMKMWCDANLVKIISFGGHSQYYICNRVCGRSYELGVTSHIRGYRVNGEKVGLWKQITNRPTTEYFYEDGHLTKSMSYNYDAKTKTEFFYKDKILTHKVVTTFQGVSFD